MGTKSNRSTKPVINNSRIKCKLFAESGFYYTTTPQLIFHCCKIPFISNSYGITWIGDFAGPFDVPMKSNGLKLCRKFMFDDFNDKYYLSMCCNFQPQAIQFR